MGSLPENSTDGLGEEGVFTGGAVGVGDGDDAGLEQPKTRLVTSKRVIRTGMNLALIWLFKIYYLLCNLFFCFRKHAPQMP
jgi:hypothetical protein